MCGVAIPERAWWQGMRQSGTRASDSGRSASEAERAIVFGAAFLPTVEIDPQEPFGLAYCQWPHSQHIGHPGGYVDQFPARLTRYLFIRRCRTRRNLAFQEADTWAQSN